MQQYHDYAEAGEDSDSSELHRLEQDRHRNDQKLKTRFEHIFRKYEHDFEGVGDEIDIATGDIVVDNGHLQYMRHEADPGKSASSRFVRTFQQKLEHEDESTGEEECEDEEEEYDERDEEDSEGESASAETDVASRSGHPAPLSEQQQRRLKQVFGNMARPAPRLAQLLVGGGPPQKPLNVTGEEDSQDVSSTVSDVTTPSNVVGEVPHVEESILAMKTKRRQQEADTNAIQQLGVSIANQLAQLMAGAAQNSPRSKTRSSFQTGSRYRSLHRPTTADPAWSYPEIPRGSKRRRTTSPNLAARQQPVASSPAPGSPGQNSLWAPEGSVRPSKRPRRGESVPDEAATSASVASGRRLLRSSRAENSKTALQRCWNCSVTSTPNWREGPHGQSLCHSCAKYYKRYRRMKPFDSPTPSIEDETAEEEDQIAGQRHQSVSIDAVPLPDADVVPSILEDHVDESPPEETVQLLEPAAADGVPQASQSHALQAPLDAPIHTSEENGLATSESALRTPSTSYAANTSRPIVGAAADSPQKSSPSASSAAARGRFSVEEDALLIKLKEQLQLSWSGIEKYFPGRNVFGLQTRYSTRLHAQDCEGRRLLQSRGWGLSNAQLPHPASTERSTWDNKLDDLLLELIEGRSMKWDDVAAVLHQNSAAALKTRYNELVAERRGHRDSLTAAPMGWDKVNPADEILGRRNKRFSVEEDAMLVRLREIDQLEWPEIRTRFPDRSLQGLCRHYYRNLAPDKRKNTLTNIHDPVQGTVEDRLLAMDPQLGGDTSAKPFDAEEDAMVKHLKEQQHLGWDDIATRLNRTPRVLEHRYRYMLYTEAAAAAAAAAVTAQSAAVATKAARIGGPSSSMLPSQFVWSAIDGKLRKPRDRSSRMLRSNTISPASTSFGRRRARSSDLPATETPASQDSQTTGSRPGPGSRTAFTPIEDAAILRLKDIDDESWESIALQLPGRSVNAVIDRYFCVLQPSARRANVEGQREASNSVLPFTPQMQQQAMPRLWTELSPIASIDTTIRAVHIPYSLEEDEVIIRLRQQGLAWREIAAHLPGRSSTSVRGRYSTATVQTRMKNSLPTRLPSGAPSSGSTLLRKALSNSTCRRSDKDGGVTDPATVEVDDQHGGFEGTNGEPFSGRSGQESTQLCAQLLCDDTPGVIPQTQCNTQAPMDLAVRGRTDSIPTQGCILQPAFDGIPPPTATASTSRKGIGASSRDDEPFVPDDAGSWSSESGLSQPDDDNPSPVRTRRMSRRQDSVPVEAAARAAAVASPKSTLRKNSLGSASDWTFSPELSFSQLVRVAFEANSKRPMQCKDIYKWVETNYDFYQLSPTSWKARIRAELSHNSCFERDVTETGEVAWRLVEGNEAESWGLTRGPRRKRGNATRLVISEEDADDPANPEGTAVAGDDEMNAVRQASQQLDRVTRSQATSTATAYDDHPSRGVEQAQGERALVADTVALARHETVESAHGSKMTGSATKPTPEGRRLSLSMHEIPDSDEEDFNEQLQPDPSAHVSLDAISRLNLPSGSNSQSSSEIRRSPESSSSSEQADSSIGSGSKAKTINSALKERPSRSDFAKPGTPASLSAKSRSTPRPTRSRLSSIKSEAPSSRANSPTAIYVHRASSLASGRRGSSKKRVSFGKRILETPMREVDPDEDELAL